MSVTLVAIVFAKTQLKWYCSLVYFWKRIYICEMSFELIMLLILYFKFMAKGLLSKKILIFAALWWIKIHSNVHNKCWDLRFDCCLPTFHGASRSLLQQKHSTRSFSFTNVSSVNCTNLRDSQFPNLKSKAKKFREMPWEDCNWEVSNILAHLTFVTDSISCVNLELFT